MSEKHFINYAHRGASEYTPENTFLAFYMGIYMGANGIETDVQKTKDGVLVLFHDDSLERVMGQSGAISDYTYSQLCEFNVKNGDLTDKIVTLDEFIEKFAFRDITFAIELKYSGYEKEVSDIIVKYNAVKKCVVTSFRIECLEKIKKINPEIKTGYLAFDDSDETFTEMINASVDEYCPNAELITSEKVEKWHKDGFNVRAWGVINEELMKNAYDAGADGMTVNFPDKLNNYINK